MEVHTLVKATAQVINVTNLEVGSVYKRVAKKGYGGDEVEVVIGVVTGILASSQDTAITAMEFSANYSSVEATIKAFSGDADILIHPATPTEITSIASDLIDLAVKSVASAKQSVLKAEKVLEELMRITDSNTELKATTEVTS